MSKAISASSCSRLGGFVADFSDALVSLASSIGPPGSAREIAIPATNGARRTRTHSSSVKSLLVVKEMSSLFCILVATLAWHDAAFASVSRADCAEKP